MADSDWWRELAARFKEIHDYGVPFWGEWIPGNTKGKYVWGLRGSDHCAARFEEIAKLAASMLFPAADDKLAAWLTLLKDENPRASSVRPAEDRNIRPPGGRILEVARVAAEHCLRLAAQNIEIEKTITDSKRSKEPVRHGYRDEIRAWMDDHGIETVPLAAKRLGLSLSTLKSIMSSKGQIRYSNDTLKRVLGEIQKVKG